MMTGHFIMTANNEDSVEDIQNANLVSIYNGYKVQSYKCTFNKWSERIACAARSEVSTINNVFLSSFFCLVYFLPEGVVLGF